MYAAWEDAGCRSRSGPSSRSNHFSRCRVKVSSISALASASTFASWRSEIRFSSSLRAMGSGSPESSAASVSVACSSSRRSSFSFAEDSTASSPSSSRSA